MVIDDGCASCGKQRCSFCFEELLPAGEKSMPDISAFRNQPPRHAALPTATSHVPHSDPSRAATPLDIARSTISNIRLTGLPSAPCQPHQCYTLGPSTIASTGTGTQSETPAQQTSDLASAQWDVANCEQVFPVVPVHEPSHDSSAATGTAEYEDTGSHLRIDIPQHAGVLGQPITPSSAFISHHDCPMHNRSEISGYSVRQVQSFESQQVDHVAGAIGASASALISEGQSLATGDIPVYTDGSDSDALLPLWPGFSLDISEDFFAGLNAQKLPRILDHDSTASVLPQLPLAEYEPPEPPSSNSKSPDILKPIQDSRNTKHTSRPYKCCESGEKQRFACLFYKYHPQLHIDCMKKSFDTIGHLRQHLNQSHKLGPNHCTSCWRSFDTIESRDQHVADLCMSTGGIPVDLLPEFPRMRMPADKKWYWGWKKLFGEAAPLPQCPFTHPLEDLEAQLQPRDRSQSQPGWTRRGWSGGLQYNYTEGMSLFTSSDWALADGEKLLNGDPNVVSSYPSATMSPSTQSSDFELDIELVTG
ncbi:hypothetical protein F4802DRAFT_143022 [Xylaria palmicola]|nr:hypothetical protein F4802DRAFT_143022 [Xylaria palmicola]